MSVNVHQLSGNLVVGPLTVDSTNNEVTVGSGITLASGGTITASGFSGNGSGLTQVNSDQGSWVNGANSNIHLAVSTDKVGIGVENPGTALEIFSTTGTQLTIRSDSRYSTIFAIDDAGSSFFGNDRGDIRFTTGGDATDGTGASEKMRILGNGNVGINTTAPGEKLHVNGNFRLGSSLNNTVDDDAEHSIATAGQLTIKSNDSGQNSSYVNLILQSGKTNPGKIVIGGGDTDLFRDIEFYTSGSSTERMRIHHDGNVGIGTSSPAEKLDVSGKVTATNIYPDPIAFFAWPGGSNLVPSDNSVVIWPNTDYNYGSCYNAATGKFTVPVQGIYLLTATMRVHSVFLGTSYFDIYHNLTRIVRSETARAENNTDPGSDHITATVTYKASVGDTFYVYNNLNMQGDANNRIDNFSGVLITPF
jgi:hypothetical protein